MLVALKSGSERFKGFLLRLERDRFHAGPENRVGRLTVGSEGLRALEREGAGIGTSGEVCVPGDLVPEFASVSYIAS